MKIKNINIIVSVIALAFTVTARPFDMKRSSSLAKYNSLKVENEKISGLNEERVEEKNVISLKRDKSKKKGNLGIHTPNQDREVNQIHSSNKSGKALATRYGEKSKLKLKEKNNSNIKFKEFKDKGVLIKRYFSTENIYEEAEEMNPLKKRHDYAIRKLGNSMEQLEKNNKKIIQRKSSSLKIGKLHQTPRNGEVARKHLNKRFLVENFEPVHHINKKTEMDRDIMKLTKGQSRFNQHSPKMEKAQNIREIKERQEKFEFKKNKKNNRSLTNIKEYKENIENEERAHLLEKRHHNNQRKGMINSIKAVNMGINDIQKDQNKYQHLKSSSQKLKMKNLNMKNRSNNKKKRDITMEITKELNEFSHKNRGVNKNKFNINLKDLDINGKKDHFRHHISKVINNNKIKN